MIVWFIFERNREIKDKNRKFPLSKFYFFNIKIKEIFF